MPESRAVWWTFWGNCYLEIILSQFTSPSLGCLHLLINKPIAFMFLLEIHPIITRVILVCKIWTLSSIDSMKFDQTNTQQNNCQYVSDADRRSGCWIHGTSSHLPNHHDRVILRCRRGIRTAAADAIWNLRQVGECFYSYLSDNIDVGLNLAGFQKTRYIFDRQLISYDIIKMTSS